MNKESSDNETHTKEERKKIIHKRNELRHKRNESIKKKKFLRSRSDHFSALISEYSIYYNYRIESTYYMTCYINDYRFVVQLFIARL